MKSTLFFFHQELFNQNNKSALEYQGELFIETNRIDLANANIKKLRNLCPNSCEELEKLQSYLLDQSSKSNI